jgi:hypothetical protein
LGIVTAGHARGAREDSREGDRVVDDDLRASWIKVLGSKVSIETVEEEGRGNGNAWIDGRVVEDPVVSRSIKWSDARDCTIAFKMRWY